MLVKILKKIFEFWGGTSDRRVRSYIKIMHRLKDKNSRFLILLFSRRLQRKYGVFLSPEAKYDETLILRHPVGIVIGKGVQIGENVTIYQNVTLGESSSKYPTIGDDTIIYAGAVIIGDIMVGERCIVGANSVVTKDVPNDCIVAGVPAKIISQKTSRAK